MWASIEERVGVEHVIEEIDVDVLLPAARSQRRGRDAVYNPQRTERASA